MRCGHDGAERRERAALAVAAVASLLGLTAVTTVAGTWMATDHVSTAQNPLESPLIQSLVAIFRRPLPPTLPPARPSMSRSLARNSHALTSHGTKRIDICSFGEPAPDDTRVGVLRAANDVRVVPFFENGHALGFKIYSIRAGSELASFGFRNGDVIRSVNGRVLNSPEKALQVYELEKESRVFEVAIVRDGRDETLRVELP